MLKMKFLLESIRASSVVFWNRFRIVGPESVSGIDSGIISGIGIDSGIGFGSGSSIGIRVSFGIAIKLGVWIPSYYILITAKIPNLLVKDPFLRRFADWFRSGVNSGIGFEVSSRIDCRIGSGIDSGNGFGIDFGIGSGIDFEHGIG